MAFSWKEMGRILVRKQFLKDLYKQIKKDNLSNGAATLAYYLILSVLSVFPAALFLLTLLPYLPIPNLKEAIMDLLKQALPGEASALFTGVVQNVTSQRVERKGGEERGLNRLSAISCPPTETICFPLPGMRTNHHTALQLFPLCPICRLRFYRIFSVSLPALPGALFALFLSPQGRPHHPC